MIPNQESRDATATGQWRWYTSQFPELARHRRSQKPGIYEEIVEYKLDDFASVGNLIDYLNALEAAVPTVRVREDIAFFLTWAASENYVHALTEERIERVRAWLKGLEGKG